MAPIPIHGLTSDELRAAARERMPRGHGRGAAIYRESLRSGRFTPEEHGLSATAVAHWREHFQLALPEVVRVVTEDPDEDALPGTAKAVLRAADGLEFECVRIPMGRGRYTLCVSSQVGCRMGCRFCETARLGLLRQLRAEEIVAQILCARHQLGWEIRNIVFMGMGEALDNWPALLQALRVLTERNGLAFSQERLTVCTVGHAEGIRRLAELGWKRLNLSVSLNAGNDATRSELMPVNRRTPLRELRDLLAAYRPRRNFALGVNYCLMPGINDSRGNAAEVAAFCRPLGRCLVNVIPYNPGKRPLTHAPETDAVERFIAWLRADGCAVRRRVTKGRSVMAACGQLGNVALRERAARQRSRGATVPVK